MIALGSVHEAVEQDAGIVAEQFGELHLFGPLVGADPFEHEIFGHRTAGRQRAALGGDRLQLAAESDLGIEQRISRGPVFSAFVGEGQMWHHYLLGQS